MEVKEIGGLTVGAIDWLTVFVEGQPGLIKGSYITAMGVCALGAIGLRESDCYESSEEKLAVESHAEALGLTADNCELTSAGACVAMANDRFGGVEKERKEYMLAWLEEQRSFKCSRWTAPPIEVVPQRKAVLA